ncbi:hypothetical protein G6027_03120 [Dietzia sp. SLG310A2-38A2]|uniref:hypothetical protein n=1 Tax=Dietzia sp. SLG310A2-38A2 TaxID=1630643 RepID=UPI0015F92FFA|nr:hypothetical protein [Dietzia sp. SLG310A2-38A2]
MSSSSVDLRRRLHALAFDQAGYFTAAQAIEVGYSYQAQKYHVDCGNWTRVDRGIFRLPDWPAQPLDEFVRWTLWSGGRGVVSYESALRVHGLSDADPARLHLVVPEGFRAEDPYVVTHLGEVDPGDTVAHQGWSVTSVLRTLVDVAGESAVSQEIVDEAVAQALERELTTRRRLLRRSYEAPTEAALRIERALARESDG